MRWLLAWIVLMLGSTAVADEPPDLIVRVGRIWTGDPDRPFAEAIAAREGRILAVGKADEVLKLKGANTRVLDRPDAFATPGLIDAHGHLESLGKSTESIDLRGVDSPEKVAALVKARIEATPADRWILGQNWDQSLWPGGEFPTSDVLDRIAPDRPVWLTRVDGHAGWANREAMRRAKVDAQTKAPSGGQIHHTPQGEPTGIVVDAAMGLIQRVIPGDTEADVIRHLVTAQKLCFENGLTSVHDAGIYPESARAFRLLDEDGRLKLRVYGMMRPGAKSVEYVSQPPAPARPGSRFELRAIKLMMDGAMGSRGALVFEPYEDDSTNLGLTLIDPERLQATTAEALRNGWQVCTHAIGDKGNATVLDAYQAARAAVPEARDPRLRIEHAQVIRKADISRFVATGTIASMQPSHASTDMRWADARLGKDTERVQGAYAWRWFADARIPLAFGSDFPVEVPSPFWGIYAAATRQDEKGEPPAGWHPEQILTIDEALRGFTVGSAYAAFAEHRQGLIRPGYLADLTVIDRDLLQIPPKAIREAKVVATIVNGEVVYEAR